MSNRFLLGLVIVGALSSPPLATHAHEEHKGKAEIQKSEPSRFAFPHAAPGTYRLPAIKPAGDGIVIDDSGKRINLATLLEGRITVLTFMYTRCGDVCPTATLQMSLLQDLAAQHGTYGERIRLLSLSLDPDFDTPTVMAEFAGQWRSHDPAAPAWEFLTTPDRATLAPMLAAYDQAVAEKPDPDAAGGPLHHIFRSFLIDPSGQVRNIYSLDFLDPELIFNDIQTLIIERDPGRRNTSRTK
jgi:cytochrome oxidase Cu insertion factor (SCO1/SenC/PrrC family)